LTRRSRFASVTRFKTGRSLTLRAAPAYGASVKLRGKKLGVLISCAPEEPGFRHGLRVAEAAIKRGVNVYLYCIDDAVMGVADAELQNLKAAGLNFYACAYGAHKRHLALTDDATFAGLTVVNDIIAGTDRFVSFN
jgi:hypothetical protein